MSVSDRSRRLAALLLPVLALTLPSCARTAQDELWSLTLSTPGRDMLYDLATSADAVYAVGELSPTATEAPATPTPGWSGKVVKVSLSGEILWTRDLPGATPGMALTALAYESGVIVGGITGEPERPWFARSAVLSRFSSDGTVLWSRSISRLRHSVLYDLALHNGKIYATLGSTDGYNTTSTEAPFTGRSSVSIIELSPSGEILAEHVVGRVLSQDSSYVLVSAGENLVYVGDTINPTTGSVESVVIAFAAGFAPVWRITVSDTVLAGVGAVAVGPGPDPVIYIGGHFRERLTIAGNSFLGSSPVRRNGFITSITSDGTVLDTSVLLPTEGGDWASVYAIAPTGPTTALAVGEFLTAVKIGPQVLRSVGDLDSMYLALSPSGLSARSTGTLVRDAALRIVPLDDCTVVLASIAGGGRNDPNGENVVLSRRSVRGLSGYTCR
jgi:hypothetical protein